MKKIYLTVLYLFLLSFPSWAQGSEGSCGQLSKYLYWTGEQNDDFFNEANWRIVNQLPAGPSPSGQAEIIVPNSAKPYCLPGSNKLPNQICPSEIDLTKDKYPDEGTLEPGMQISYNLWIENASIDIPQSLSFVCSEIGLTLVNSEIGLQAPLQNGVISLDKKSTLTVQENGVLGSDVYLNFNDLDSWAILKSTNPDQFLSSMQDQIWIQNSNGTLDLDYRINQFYQSGTLIRPYSSSYVALEIYSGTNLSGTSADIHETVIYSGSGIPNDMNDMTSSFKLKRGFMATFSVAENGTSKSKVYIASTEDLVIESLPAALQSNVSFIRVLPWNWVIKKGTGGFTEEVNAGWYYNWGNSNESQPNYEYVPMAWGAGATAPQVLKRIIEKDKVNHLLGFNESDNCDDQSGQFNNLCKIEVAVGYYENLMKTGMRLGTPAPRENGPTGWLLEFAELAKARDVRFDFVAVHWYDWGSNPANSPNADPQVIFNRFKTYLENVHRIYGLPIWITEFNANPNRGNAIQAAFLELALPYLESLEYVERYAYFEPMSANSSNPVDSADLTDENGNLTNIGEIYYSHLSTPSIPEATFESDGNLQGLNDPFTPETPEIMSFEAECALYLGNKWEVIEDEESSNGKYVRGNNTLEGASALASQLHYELDLSEAKIFKIWLRAKTLGGTGIKVKIDDGEFETIGGLNTSEFNWLQLPRFYSLQAGKHRISFEYTNNSLLLDQLALITTSDEVNLAPSPINSCIETQDKWGQTSTDIIYWLEAEAGIYGNQWEVNSSETAIGGEFLEAIPSSSSLISPPGTDGQVSFNFEIEEKDQYRIWGKIQSLSTEDNSLWIKIDNEPFRKWDNLENDAFEWYWKLFHFSEGGEDRALPFFLTEGNHIITIAYSTQEFKIDRLAIASEGKLPAEEDPDVVRVFGPMDYEAENAELLGNAIAVNCGASSNGQQVNFRTGFSSGVRFNQVIAAEAGAYILSVHYMSKVQRNFRLIVNGESLGYQKVTPSGNWCFEGGNTAIYEITVNLNKGVNVIEILRTETDAPFLDKISLNKQIASLEAEEARLEGSSAIANCLSASNGALVNMGFSYSNAIIFENVKVTTAGNYQLEISYISAVDRTARVIINGTTSQVSFMDSGEWCGNGGVPATKVIEVELLAGDNQIEIRPAMNEAPLIDKIEIIEVAKEQEDLISARILTTEAVATVPSELLLSIEDFNVYPNPVRSYETINISLPNLQENGTLNLSISDMYGRVWVSENHIEATGQKIELENNLRPGLYLIIIQNGNQLIQHKLLVK
ncbi:glycosyl hydrolase [Algoriphagus pacificus]|uniref:T9SS type A sorting domain-containing protein n=1 Tax=Algoriphagus pacificus TaxID=2811234 RepID=A0ABS3CIM2_9BACT|nr:glycosyl hydrolase [Algoriphagus pacificus]MBN7816952.1 T9SS type A sorting domain-containing protein [Algoriphagus pacificus]